MSSQSPAVPPGSEAEASLESPILDGLNPEQREAVLHEAGAGLILAGPGSGKTRVITHRVAYLVRERHVPPWRILAVTFTNKAAREMRERVERHLPPEDARDLWLGTFHAICGRILRVDGEAIGVPRNFGIYDDADQIALVKNVLEELGIDNRQFSPRSMLGMISRAKSEGKDARDFARSARSYPEEVAGRVYERYQQRLVDASALDFDDMLLQTVELLRSHPQTLEKYAGRFLHVLVDEFQDTNVTQYVLARQLASVHGNITVVGDPDQSIYSWRSADIRNILNFEADYPDCRIFFLEQNYRSTQNILDAAHAVIAKWGERKQKRLWTENEGGHPIELVEARDEDDEADRVGNEIRRLGGEDGRRWQDFAVMYRTNAQSRALEEAMVRMGIRYRLIGGTRFYERREIRDLVAYLRLVHNRYDWASLRRVINTPLRGIGDKTIDTLERWSLAENRQPWDSLLALRDQRVFGAAGSSPFSPRQTVALVDFAETIESADEMSKRVVLPHLLDSLTTRIGYRQHLEKEFRDDWEERWENVGELRNVVAQYEDVAENSALEAFLQDVALISDADELKGDEDAVTLITLHAAKGLEFPVVFMIGLEEGVLPHIRSLDSREQIDEERRLCYVGMTRARERLYLSRAFARGFRGLPNPESRFLKDVPRELLVIGGRRGDAAATARERRAELSARLSEDQPEAPQEPAFSDGDHVYHPKFGEGVVVSCKVVGGDQEVHAVFDPPHGLKRLLQSFAQLKKV
jgi:DNA helicase-2/ATP-dependent DNA helicase PcrA